MSRAAADPINPTLVGRRLKGRGAIVEPGDAGVLGRGGPEAEGLMRAAAESSGISPDAVQVLLIVSALLPRLAWKYASMTYALVF